MSGKRHRPEEIIAKLRQVDVMTSQGTTEADAVQSIGVIEVTYRWRQEIGGTRVVRLARLQVLLRAADRELVVRSEAA